MYPYIVFIVNILVPGNVIICINIGHIIILRIIVANRAPIRLAADIYARADTYLSTCSFE